MKTTARLATLCAIIMAGHAPAQELTVDVGYTDYPEIGEDSGILGVGYRHSPFYETGAFSVSLAANASVTEESDIFLGAGIAARWALQNGWFLDFSFMPGYYDPGTARNDLGNDLEFRSLLGLGYTFDGGQSVSLAVTHKSNASISDYNPGVDAVLLRFHLPL